MKEDKAKEFIGYINNNSNKISKMFKCMEKDELGSPSYQAAIEYIKDLCDRSKEFADFLNNLLNDK